jgi:hypothetical protein
MAKRWVLDSETKGTGARVVPLQSKAKRSSVTDPVLVPREGAEHRQPTPAEALPRQPRRFRVVDRMTRETLVEDGNARHAADALQNVRSIVDVTVYTWQEHRDRWRPLTFEEQRALWDLAHP